MNPNQLNHLPRQTLQTYDRLIDSESPTGQPASLADWLALAHGPLPLNRVLEALLELGSVQAVVAHGEALLAAVLASSRRRNNTDQAQAASSTWPPPSLSAWLDQAQTWLHDPKAPNPRAILTLDDPRYPSALLQIHTPPLILYAEGRLELLHQDSWAVVGSRRATADGLDYAERCARALGQAGWSVVSGLALGIDAAAHRGALTTAASTIGVIGTGIDQCYPRQHSQLKRSLSTQGLVLSEFRLGTPAIGHHFPQRNRLIAGLARGVLVIQAAQRSGSLVTARLALEADREVYALPGTIDHEQHQGSNRLLQQGARLVVAIDEFIEEISALKQSNNQALNPPSPDPTPLRVTPNESTPDLWANPPSEPPPPARDANLDLEPDQQRLLQLIGPHPIHTERLLPLLDWPEEHTLTQLALLQMLGYLQRQPGGAWYRVRR